MALASYTPPNDGVEIRAKHLRDLWTAISAQLNGNLDGANFANASIAYAKLSLSANEIPASKLALGIVAQVVGNVVNTVQTGTTVLPFDDTIPQNTEGIEVITQAITPKATTNILIIEATIVVSSSVANWISAALFQDTTAGALAAVPEYQATATGTVILKLQHKMTAGTTSATTFKIRVGGNAAGTTTINGSGGGRAFGGVCASSLKITEYNA